MIKHIIHTILLIFLVTNILHKSAIGQPLGENEAGKRLEALKNSGLSYSEWVQEAKKLERQAEKQYRYDIAGDIYYLWSNKIDAVRSMDSVLLLLRTASRYYYRSGDSALAIKAVYRMGTVFGQNEIIDSAVYYLSSGIQTARQAQKEDLLCRLYNSLGNSLVLGRNYPMAAQAFRNAIRYSEKAGDLTYLALAYQNYGNIYFDTKQFDSAIALYNIAARIALQNGDTAVYLMTRINSAGIYLEQNEPDSTIKVINEIQNSAPGFKRPYLTALLNANLGLAMVKKEDYARAHNYYQLAENHLKKEFSASIATQLFHNISELYLLENNYEEAFKYREKYRLLNDSIASALFSERMAALQVRFSHEEETWKKDLRHQVELGRWKAQRNILFAIAGGLFLTVVFLYIFIRNKKRTNIKLAHVNRITQELNSKLLLLTEIAETLTSGIQTGDLTGKIYEASRRIYPFDSVAIGLIETDTGNIVFSNPMENGNLLPRVILEAGKESPAFACFRSQKIIMVEDLQKDWARYYSMFENVRPVAGQMMRTVIYAPLTVQDRKIGVITWQAHNKIDLANDPLLVFKNLSAIVAIALENHLHLHALQERNREISLALTQLEAKEKQLIEAHAAKDRLFSVIAHDLRSPFNVILGLADTLREETGQLTPEEISGHAHNIFQAAEQTYHLLENLLEWSGNQLGLAANNPEPTQIAGVINETLLFIKDYIREKNMGIQTEVSYHEPVIIDKNHLRTVIRNLLTNAIKFSHPGGIIKITVARDNDTVLKVTITDQGIGMTQNLVENLFRLDADTQRPGTRREKGTGLGLHICKAFIEGWGGQIMVDSQTDSGTSFTFTVPI